MASEVENAPLEELIVVLARFRNPRVCIERKGNTWTFIRDPILDHPDVIGESERVTKEGSPAVVLLAMLVEGSETPWTDEELETVQRRCGIGKGSAQWG